MSRAFTYKPRFVDIRIKPPGGKAEAEARTCDWAECSAPGVCRAPMGPDKIRQFYFFCPAHAAEYNKNWDYFADMTPDQAAAYQASAAYGHRPTWNTNRAPNARAQARAKADWARLFADPFHLFGDPGAAPAEPKPRERRLGRLETLALETLGLGQGASGGDVRTRYAELVKAYHPDANGGDRSTEERLTQVIRAYKTLRKAGYA